MNKLRYFIFIFALLILSPVCAQDLGFGIWKTSTAAQTIYPTLYTTVRELPTSGSSAEYMGLVGSNASSVTTSTTELRSIISIPGGGKFYGISVNLSGANLPASTALTVQMLKNGGSNAAYPQCVVAAASTTCTDSTSTDNMSVNGTTDYAQYELTIAGGTPAWPSTQTYINVAILFVPNSTNAQPFFNENTNGTSYSSSPLYGPPGINVNPSATEANVSVMFSAAGTIENLVAAPSANETANGTHTIAITQGHAGAVADTAITCVTTVSVSTACTDLFATTGHSISVAVGDTISFHVTQTGSTSWTNQYMAMGFTFIPTTPGQSVLVQGSTGAFQTNSTYFMLSGADASSTTQNIHYSLVPNIAQLPSPYTYTKAVFQDLILACSAVGSGYRTVGLYGSGTAFATPILQFTLTNGSTTHMSSSTTLSVGWQATAYGFQDTTDTYGALSNTLVQDFLTTVSSPSSCTPEKSSAVVTWQ